MLLAPHWQSSKPNQLRQSLASPSASSNLRTMMINCDHKVSYLVSIAKNYIPLTQKKMEAVPIGIASFTIK